MTSWMVLVTTTAIGSAIGGVTNRLAIQMLFRPYNEWKIAGIRVPFTPGLIPRRRAEISLSMGRLVEDYLLTKDGLKQSLAESGLSQALERWLLAYIDRTCASEQSVAEWLHRFIPEAVEETGQLGAGLRPLLLNRWTEAMQQLQQQYGSYPLRQLLPDAAQEKLDTALEEVTEQLLHRLRMYLRSPEGINQLQEMMRHMIGGGGMLGGLVGMFLGDDKIIAKVQTQLDRLLSDQQVKEKVTVMLKQEAGHLLDKQVSEVVAWIGEEQLAEWQLRLFAWLESKGQQFLQQPLSQLAGRLREPLAERYLPRLVNWMIEMLQQNVDRLFDRLQIASIVAKQVEGFPLQRIEEMIIGISGKEFRMITTLGFILGGLIGFVQGLFNLYLW